MRGKYLTAGAGAVLLGMIVGFLSVRMRQSATPAPKSAPAAVRPGEVHLTGIVRAQHIVPVAPDAPGIVEALPVEVGQDVYQGEVLARVGDAEIDNSREAASEAVQLAQSNVSQAQGRTIAVRIEAARAGTAVERAQADLERARKIYERQKMLHDAGATPRLVYERSEQDYEASRREVSAAQRAVSLAADETEAANAALSTARKELADSTARAEFAQLAYAAAEVRSPVDGVLFAVHAEPGKRWEGGAMFEIATDLDELEVEAEATYDVAQAIRPGMAAMVAAAGSADSEIPGVVRDVKNQRVIVEFHNTLSALKVGMRATVRLRVE